jgi:hypothetical protein
MQSGLRTGIQAEVHEGALICLANFITCYIALLTSLLRQPEQTTLGNKPLAAQTTRLHHSINYTNMRSTLFYLTRAISKA